MKFKPPSHVSFRMFGALTALCAFCASVSTAQQAPSNQQEEALNIVMIVVEDWSAFAIGAYGNEVVQTPNVDRFAETAVVFDRAYCQGPVCNPSRASFVTGLRPDTTRVYGNGEEMDDFIPAGAPSMAEILSRKDGAYLATTGKIVHKWEDAGRFAKGYDFLEYSHPYDKPPGFEGELRFLPWVEGGPREPEEEAFYLADKEMARRLREAREVRDAKLAAGAEDNWPLRKPFQQLHAEQLGDSGLPAEMMEDGRIARSASGLLADLAKREEGPFFLSLGFYATHTPLLAPKEFVDLYDPDEMELSPATPSKDVKVPQVARRNGRNYDIFNGFYPEFDPTPERERKALASYYACASFVDAQVGIILDAIEANGLADNTIVVLFSDHGFQVGEHGMWSKYSLFEQSTRVPLMVRDPRAKANGQRCDEIVELVDLLPTFCDFWGLEKDSLFEGVSFAPLLDDPQQEWKQAAFSMIPIGGLGRGVRTKDFRYAEWRKDKAHATDQSGEVVRELYDLTRDPLEQVNVVDDPLYQEQVRYLSQLLREGYHAAQP
ncbi:sulfatase [Pelagicoccus enzymogenes]|uniref:sulfatase n=1 Tax=Pelagicoccus enzymogenes TaxID=2773457 RepID=UPI00280EE6A6|nr:sulfatase [Pelagicoccus enzymogenes]MDQ8197981.1 sulfatase [Pelagicoccus enzymogenes]